MKTDRRGEKEGKGPPNVHIKLIEAFEKPQAQSVLKAERAGLIT